MPKHNYTEASIRVLKGLEPVRQRPGMYTKTETPFHIIQEAIDNASDEALAGYAKRILITLHADGSASVADDGRGIPVGLHPEEGVPTVEIVFTRLHAGGKFDKKGAAAYAFAGGLHGVGVSVTNALSARLEVTVWRDGGGYRIVFADGEVTEPLRRIGDAERRSGTSLRIWPNPRYFDSAAISGADMEHLLRSKAVLLPGVTVLLRQEKASGEGEDKQWRYPDGLGGYLRERLDGADTVIPFFAGEHYADDDSDSFAPGEGAQWVVAWSEDGPLLRESFVNLIPTGAGGTHDSGLRDGIFQAVKNFAEIHSMLPKGVKLLPEDVMGRASYVLSAKILDPQFQGQTKERLNSRDAVKLVSSMSKAPLELWLNEHLEFGRKLTELAIRQAQHRMRAAQKVEKRRGSGVAVLPGKLTDCESRDTTSTELFLVEGDSAGGSAKQGRDKTSQAILPLRGKVLNTWEQERDRLFANAEIHDIAVAIGVDPHDGQNADVDLSGLRYARVCILADADVDGSHIQVLLISLFLRHFPRLVEAGRVYVAQPPLFRIDVPAQGKKRPQRKLYALDDSELEITLDKLKKEGVRDGSWSISRFKGLGEMSAEQLWETTMNPDTRRLARLRLDDGGWVRTNGIVNMLMAKGEAAARRRWLEEHGNEVEADV
jgi:topoisomerase-4 subunit B